MLPTWTDQISSDSPKIGCCKLIFSVIMGCSASKGLSKAHDDFGNIRSAVRIVLDDNNLRSKSFSSLLNLSVESHRGLVGLKNLGNTCFLNASIQCLSNTAPLVDFFLKKNWQREINRMNPSGKSGEVAESFGELIRQMWLGSAGSSVISPDKFKRILGIHQPQFSGYEQHDAQELLAFLLDGLHEDLNRVKLKPYVEDIESDGFEDDTTIAALAWSSYLKRNRSVIVDLSQGQLKSTLRCLTCDVKSVKFDAFMYLSLPIVKRKKQIVSLRSCIREFCKAEILNGDSQWRCPKCDDFRDSEKRLSLWTLPSILIIHLKRYDNRLCCPSFFSMITATIITISIVFTHDCPNYFYHHSDKILKKELNRKHIFQKLLFN